MMKFLTSVMKLHVYEVALFPNAQVNFVLGNSNDVAKLGRVGVPY